MKPMGRWAAVLCGAAGVACGSSIPAPSDEWAAAQADIGRAQANGAPQVPEANLHLEMAVEDLQRSRTLMGQDNERATTLTELARAEAQLATSLAKETTAQQAVRGLATGMPGATALPASMTPGASLNQGGGEP
jgi:hypothetical protein